MSNLTRFKTETGIELVINADTGEAFTTVSGYARMSGKAKSTISERLETVRNEDLKTAEIQIGRGLRTVRLIPAKLIFKWLMKDNPDLAEKIGECGTTVYLHQLANDWRKGKKKKKGCSLAELRKLLNTHEPAQTNSSE